MAYLGRRGASAPLTSADIPDSSITTAKIVDGTVAEGDLAFSTATQAELDAQRTNSSITTLGTVTAGTYNATIGNSATGFGLTTFVESYKLTSTFTGSDTAISGWTATDKYSPNSLTMTEASGIWTFPETGVYEITFQATSAFNAVNRHYEADILTTTNNFSGSYHHYGYTSSSPNTTVNHYFSTMVETIFDVVSTSTYKLKLGLLSQNSNADTRADETYCIFKRIGDT